MSDASASTTAARTGGDFDYDKLGHGYAQIRRTDPRIAAMVHEALGNARVILNVGAGAGSYEPTDQYVLAIEPSATMRAQRPAHLIPAIHGFAESLPLDDQSVDASMAMVTVHQWADWKKGLAELRRVTRGLIVLLTFDGDALERFWLADYASELMAAERERYPDIKVMCAELGTNTTAKPVPIPIDCVDGFTEAYYTRPEKFLDVAVRRAQSAWGFITAGEQERAVEKLKTDLASGGWEKKYGHWRKMPTFEGSLRLIVSRPEGRIRF